MAISRVGLLLRPQWSTQCLISWPAITSQQGCRWGSWRTHVTCSLLFPWHLITCNLLFLWHPITCNLLFLWQFITCSLLFPWQHITCSLLLQCYFFLECWKAKCGFVALILFRKSRLSSSSNWWAKHSCIGVRFLF